MKLLSINNDSKTRKSNGKGARSNQYLTAIQYLAPHTNAGGKTVCPMAETAKCSTPCLYTAGRGAMSSVQQARIARTKLYQSDPDQYFELLYKEIIDFESYCFRKGRLPAIRLNGTSDIAWENTSVIEDFPHVQFYDYTKLITRKVPANYHLTASYSGANAKYADSVLDCKLNWAVVFDSTPPDEWGGRPVIDGDRDDLRFLDPHRCVVGLTAKGAAKRDTSGFVIRSV